jgi:hypothetical protein
MRRSFPADYGTRGCVLVPIDMALLPIVAGLLQPLEEERSWLPEDYEEAYWAIAALEACMAVTCLDDLIESNAKLYRLIDSGLFGRVYDAGALPPGTITPIIPAVPDLDFANPGLLGKVEYLSQAFQSMVGGIETPNFSGTPSVLALLQGVIDALNAEDTDFSDIISNLELIAALLA